MPLSICFPGTKYETYREHVAYLHFILCILYCLIKTVGKYSMVLDITTITDIIFVLVRLFFEDALPLLWESCAFFWRCPYVSCIDLSDFMSLELDV